MSHVSCPRAVASLLLVGLVWALFGQTGSFEFLRFDDPDYTFNCAFVKDGLSWANVREAFTNVRHAAIWMPVTNISYMCTISWFGPGAGAHHLVSVAIHALNAVLLLWLLVSLATKNTKITKDSCFAAENAKSAKKIVVAFLLSAFWALHPQRAEAVAWIASRKELLCTTFILGGLLCWLSARRREGWGGWMALVGTYACFVLACMSKPTAMCFPFLVLAVEGFLRATGDMRHATCDRREATFDIRNSKFYIVNSTIFLLMAAAVGALAVYSQTHPEGHAELALFSAPLGWRILNAAVAVGLYIYQMFIPVGIHLDYRAVPGGWPVQGAFGLGVLALVVGGIVGIWWWRRSRGPVMGMLAVGLWFFASLGPTLGIFGSFGEHARADRFLYLPAMALPIVAMLLWLVVILGQRASCPLRTRGRASLPTGTTGILPVAGLAGLALVVAVFFAVAYPIVASYRTDMTAFTHTLAVDPDNWRALAHVGEAKCAEGNLAEGIDMLRHSRTVLVRDPTNAKLAYALMSRGEAGDWDEIFDVCESVGSDPTRDPRGQALEALGTAELKKHRWTDAIQHLYLSIHAPQRHYSYADAALKMAFALQNTGRREEAREWFKWVRDRSGRVDLARRAREALIALEYSPRGMLFW